MDHVLNYMKKLKAPMTRESYLQYAYMGNPPDKLSAEEESNLPPQFKLREDSPGLTALKGA